MLCGLLMNYNVLICFIHVSKEDSRQTADFVIITWHSDWQKHPTNDKWEMFTTKCGSLTKETGTGHAGKIQKCHRTPCWVAREDCRGRSG